MPKPIQSSFLRIYYLFTFILIILSLNLEAQPFFKKANLSTTIGGIISSDSTTPFLLRSNQYGLVPYKSGIGFMNISINQNYDSLFTIDKKLKKFGLGYGLEVHTNLGNVNQILLPVAHFKVRYGAFEFYAGRRREIQGLVDTLGTMGSYIWSGNALPMPKIEISIPNYTPIIRNGLISIKGNFAHGWFGKADSVQNVLLHQKSFYVRIGKPTWKIQLLGGFNHQVQWGGYPTNPFYDAISGETIYKYSSDLYTYMNIISGISLNRKGNGLSTGAPGNEALNRAGNHLGTIDIGLEILISDHNRLKIYRQSLYDDGSLFYLSNISDGLLGITLQTNKSYLRNIGFEYFNTSNQGGVGSASIFTPELRGQDNYFTNSIYEEGWTYKGNIIGTSNFSSFKELKDRIGNPSNTNYIVNSRIKAMNIFLFYSFKNTLFGKTQIIESLNLGTYYQNLNKRQTSILQSIRYLTKTKISVNVMISSDFGQLRPINTGVNVTISKHFQ